MTARDLPRGQGIPCPHHQTALNGWDAAYHTHEEPADRERRQRNITGACCDHPRDTRDPQPSPVENP